MANREQSKAQHIASLENFAAITSINDSHTSKLYLRMINNLKGQGRHYKTYNIGRRKDTRSMYQKHINKQLGNK